MTHEWVIVIASIIKKEFTFGPVFSFQILFFMTNILVIVLLFS